MPLINGRLVRLYGFTPADIMLGFEPEWKVMPEAAQGFIEEAVQGDVNEMEEGPEGLRIERLMDKRDERQTLVVRSISENHTQQEGKFQAQ